jgi:4,5-dihydroxyphthalate decarboxylase
MRPLQISFGCTVSDRTRPLLEGRVAIEGCELERITDEPENLFARALRNEEFDVTELSLSSYLVIIGRRTSPYLAVPAFPSRAFRHSAVYVRTDRGIERPEDLVGMTIGVPEFQQTAALWVRGILADRHGVSRSAIRWRTGGLERAGGEERIPVRVREEIDLQPTRAPPSRRCWPRDDSTPSCPLDRRPASRPGIHRSDGSGPITGQRNDASTVTPGCSRSCTSS